jgi:tRNA threonylcarbamoyladenosine biosynthesis protein TsaE
MEITYTLEQLPEAANMLWKIAGDVTIIAFHGAMSSGKTTLIRALCSAMQVRDVVGSPTFSIINEYYASEDGKIKKIFHIDLYRLKDEQEAVEAGVKDCLYSDHICLVEWPEKIPSLLPENTMHVFIESVNEHTRKLRIGDN